MHIECQYLPMPSPEFDAYPISPSSPPTNLPSRPRNLRRHPIFIPPRPLRPEQIIPSRYQPPTRDPYPTSIPLLTTLSILGSHPAPNPLTNQIHKPTTPIVCRRSRPSNDRNQRLLIDVKTIIIPLRPHCELARPLLALRRGFRPLREDFADGGRVGFVKPFDIFKNSIIQA
jgi:hypothetical protein